MPVKHRRNDLSRKIRNEANPIVYSSSFGSQFSDTPTSAASSPPEHIPVLSFTPDSDPPPSDTGSNFARETTTDDVGPPDHTIGYAEDVFDFRGPDRSTEASCPTSPPSQPKEFRASVQPAPVDVMEFREEGHVRSPNLARELSTMESVSRTIRGIVPSSIPIPSVVPTPPRVSRPVSFGSFLTPSRASSSQRRSPDSDDNNWKRRGSDASADHRRAVWGENRPPQDEVNEAVFNFDEDVHTEDRSVTLRPTPTTYPSTSQGEDLIDSSFGAVYDGDTLRQVIMLGYRTGMQIWDCTNLGSVSEILNFSGPQWGAVERLEILPDPSNSLDDTFQPQRPLIGFLSKTHERSFVVYSLRTHEVMKKLSPPSLVSFSASNDFIVLSTADPAGLHIYSSRTFALLYTVPASMLALSTHPNSTDTQEFVSLSPLDRDGGSHLGITAIPHPIFALSRRLVVFASSPPDPASHTQTATRTPRTASPDMLDDGGLKFPTNQAELGVAAMKIGGTLFSGMKAIGGRAYSAARAGVSAALSSDTAPVSPVVAGKFVSRSAPEASAGGHERRYSMTSDVGSHVRSHPDDSAQAGVSAPSLSRDQAHPRDSGHFITVLDLEPLCLSEGHSAKPATIAEYMISRYQAINNLGFSADGISVVAALKDGQTARVYQLRPAARAHKDSTSVIGQSYTGQVAKAGLHNDDYHDQASISQPWHMYDLRRGRTSAVIEQLSWAPDGRWLGIGTRKRTVHIFALNPYGGPPDEASHLEGRVVNVTEAQPLSTDLTPVVRLRSPRLRADEPIPPPCAFTFLSPATSFPLSLMPPSSLTSPSLSSSPSSAHSSSTGPHSEASGGHQDVLVFDPCDGTLTLHRVTITKRSRDELSATIRGIPGASISLPGVSTLSRLAGAPSNATTPARQPSALSQMMQKSELAAQDIVIATWPLRRSLDWKDIKKPFRGRKTGHPPTARLTKADWLAQAELSTCSRSRKLVPKSIYLTHQFSFHYLDEDYHALLRSHRFDVPAQKIEVRRQVAVSASAGMSESFVSGSSAPSQGGGFPSSFDEPLASALSAELRNTHPSPPQFPSYPNGPTTRSAGRVPIPMRVAAGISDGMSEGLGRLRKEIGKVRSPKFPIHRGGPSTSVPLEFDEDDEEFVGLDGCVDPILCSGGGGAPASPIILSTGIEPLPAEHEDEGHWQGWEAEDKEAVDEAERFDDIGVGFMDEEWAISTKG